MRWVIGDITETHHGSQPIAEPPVTASRAALTIPGLASGDDLARLRSTTGSELDVLFLQLMLRHHEAGEPFLDCGTQLAEVSQVHELGVAMIDAEATQGNQRPALLAARGAGPLAG